MKRAKLSNESITTASDAVATSFRIRDEKKLYVTTKGKLKFASKMNSGYHTVSKTGVW